MHKLKDLSKQLRVEIAERRVQKGRKGTESSWKFASSELDYLDMAEKQLLRISDKASG